MKSVGGLDLGGQQSRYPRDWTYEDNKRALRDMRERNAQLELVPKLQSELANLEDSNMKLLTTLGAALLVIVAHCAYRFFTAGTLL
jgi:hypothetical protein